MRKFLWPLLPLAVAACAAPPRGEEPAAARRAGCGGARGAAAKAEAWQVTGSHLEVRVYRDGPMQKLGHNHLIISERLAGEIQLREPLAASRFALRLPLDSLVVDDPEARAARRRGFRRAGPGQGSRGDAPQHAGRKAAGCGAPGRDAAHGGVGLRRTGRLRSAGAGVAGGKEHVVAAPLTLTIDGARLVAHATFHLNHADLGLVPFNVALGALKVRDDFEVDLTVEAGRGT